MRGIKGEVVPTEEEFTAQIKTLEETIATLNTVSQGYETEKVSMTATFDELKLKNDKTEADLIVANKAPDLLRAEIDALKDTGAKTAVELEEFRKAGEEHTTTTAKLTELAKENEELKGSGDALRGKVRNSLISSLVTHHGLKEEHLRDKDLASLETIADALLTQMNANAKGLGLGDGGNGSGKTQGSQLDNATRELVALGMPENR
jgi:SMC interacting uncharacterized protein involved in chromosome segregation